MRMGLFPRSSPSGRCGNRKGLGKTPEQRARSSRRAELVARQHCPRLDSVQQGRCSPPPQDPALLQNEAESSKAACHSLRDQKEQRCTRTLRSAGKPQPTPRAQARDRERFEIKDHESESTGLQNQLGTTECGLRRRGAHPKHGREVHPGAGRTGRIESSREIYPGSYLPGSCHRREHGVEK